VRIVDLSQEIYHRRPVPGSQMPPAIWTHVTHEESAAQLRTTEWSFMTMGLIMSDHCGTHVDAFTQSTGNNSLCLLVQKIHSFLPLPPFRTASSPNFYTTKNANPARNHREKHQHLVFNDHNFEGYTRKQDLSTSQLLNSPYVVSAPAGSVTLRCNLQNTAVTPYLRPVQVETACERG